MLQAQTPASPVPAPVRHDFEGILSFLSSNWMEGREAGARGGFMAADYIASMMQINGLQPYGDEGNGYPTALALKGNRSFFQNFIVVRHHVEKSILSVIQQSAEGENSILLSPDTDYQIDPIPFSREAVAPLIFAGYGIEAPGNGYNDYADLDVRNCIVVVLDGFPGHTDTTSRAWKKLGTNFGTEFASSSSKLRVAERHGASALVVIHCADSDNQYQPLLVNRDVVNIAMNKSKPTEPEYDTPGYNLPGDTATTTIPCFMTGAEASRLIATGIGTDLSAFEKKAAREMKTDSKRVSGKKVRFSVTVKNELLEVRNVLGIIPGTDTTKNIIVGAHYDHLGTRNEWIYNGADDNASGVAGLLALSGYWAAGEAKPVCNIIFAAWTAEEKGLLGSSYYVSHTQATPDRTLLYINMDMIGRSAPDDTARRILSIGTMTVGDSLRSIAKRSNLRLQHPFELDLWDVAGHSGSDYASFMAVNIPIMTFFSGFHDDYHSPRDVASKIDARKMENILRIVNDCLWESLKNPPVRERNY